MLWLLMLTAVSGQEIMAGPLVQSLTPDDAWIVWQADVGDAGSVTWSHEGVDTQVQATVRAGPGAMPIYEAHLTGLPTDSEVSYSVFCEETGGGEWTFGPWEFAVPPEHADATEVTVLAMSDMQRSRANPEKFTEIIEDGVLEVMGAPEDSLDLVLIAGDLVDSGWQVSDWTDEFFAPAASLLPHVATYPVMGNHEEDSAYFLDYFHLPDNGTLGFEEHWWWTDRGNLRVIGLDSNPTYWVPEQFSWLDELLAATCEEEHVDFVITELHHPHRSELWTPGESPWTGQVRERLEAFSTECGRPTVLLFGHTHGYSRGHGRDHHHTMVNVATAGGAIDHWGDYPQANYPEFNITTADWGFVILRSSAGDDSTLSITRYSRGDEDSPVDNEITDELVLRRGGQAPATPQISAPGAGVSLGPDCATLVATDYSEPEGDDHGATHWQVARTCSFSEMLHDSFIQHQDLYYGLNFRSDQPLNEWQVIDLPGDESLCVRVRYRDLTQDWSEWSEAVTFFTGPRVGIGPLVEMDFETGLVGLDPSGPVETMVVGCGAVVPKQGTQFAALGGECEFEGEASVSDTASLIPWADEIEAGDRFVRVVGWFQGTGEVRVVYLDDDAEEVSTEVVGVSTGDEWVVVDESVAAPAHGRRIRVEIHTVGDRVLVDGVRVYLSDGSAVSCAPVDEADDTDTGGDTNDEAPQGCAGCGVRTGAASTGAVWAVLFGLWFRRERWV